MSKRNKLQKFAELQTLPNVFENFDASTPALTSAGGRELNFKGRWRQEVFSNDHPLTLELACGRGEYTVELAQRYPMRNFIGVDVKGARIWKGAKTAIGHQLGNVAFLRTRIEQIALFFAEKEVDEIWITFPDPFLRQSKSNRRLTSHFFLSQYAQILKPGALIHLKTDDWTLFEFTLEILAEAADFYLMYQDEDIYARPLPHPELDIRTYYEKSHLAAGKSIKYICFRFQPVL